MNTVLDVVENTCLILPIGEIIEFLLDFIRFLGFGIVFDRLVFPIEVRFAIFPILLVEFLDEPDNACRSID